MKKALIAGVVLVVAACAQNVPTPDPAYVAEIDAWRAERLERLTAEDGWLTVVGLLWLVLTLAFEFGFGRFGGRSWSSLLQEYNVVAGKVWVLIPAWVAVAPFIFHRLRT